MEFYKTKNSIVNYSNELFTIPLKSCAQLLFIHENEKKQKQVKVEKNSFVQIFSVYSKNTEIRNLFLLSENSRLEVLDIILGNNRIDNLIELKEKNIIVNLTAKGMIEKQTSSFYSAVASAKKNALNSNIKLEEHVYLIGKNAKANFLPSLEIRNNSVNAVHSSTIQEIDEDQIFYLMSRGFSKNQAKKEILASFICREIDIIKKKFGYSLNYF